VKMHIRTFVFLCNAAGVVAAGVVAAGVVAAGVVAAGCGFAGEPPFAGRRVPDVAPWQDVGPLVICDGTTRLGPPLEPAAGLCGAADGAACAADGDCRSRERCVCGRCTVAVCDSNDECAGAAGDARCSGPGCFVCTFAERRCDRACDADADCAPGESCAPGKHVCRGGCATNDDCQTGETCQSSTGACIATACADASTCLGGRACLLQRAPAALAEPSPVFDVSGHLFLFFERSDPNMGGTGAARVFRARATGDAAGLAFTLDPRTPLFDGRAASATRTLDAWFVAYEGATGIEIRAAGDGVTFGAPAFVAPAPPGAQPSLALLPDDSLFVYFVDGTGNLARVGGGKSGAGGFGTPEVVLVPAAVAEPTLWAGVDRLASPFAQVWLENDGAPTIRLWFAARGVETAPSQQFGQLVPVPPNWSIGEAASLDGVHFQPYGFNPVFDRTVDFTRHPSELDPAVIDLGSEWHLFYRRAAPDGSASENLALARTPIAPR
jgi:hypothetical protein